MRWQRGWVETEGARGQKRYVGRYRNEDGSKPKVQLGWVSEMTLTEARTKLEAIVREIGSRPQALAGLTFSEFWTLHFKPRHRVSWAEPTEAGHDSYMRAYLDPTFGKVRLSDIDAPFITAFFEKMRREYSRSVILKLWTMLHAILEDAVDDDIISKNAMRKVERPKTKLPEKPVIEADLIAQVLDEVKDNAYASAVLHVGTFCAVRTAEVFGLRWSALQGDHFVIRDSAWKGKLLQDATKTGQRSVFIPPATMAAIARWRAEATFKAPGDILFASEAGTPMSSHNFSNRVLVPVRDKLKLPALTFQVLRRSHATRNQGTPKDAQDHLGHKNITTTLGIYTQAIPASVKAMVEADEAAILSARGRVAPEMPPDRKGDSP